MLRGPVEIMTTSGPVISPNLQANESWRSLGCRWQSPNQPERSRGVALSRAALQRVCHRCSHRKLMLVRFQKRRVFFLWNCSLMTSCHVRCDFFICLATHFLEWWWHTMTRRWLLFYKSLCDVTLLYVTHNLRLWPDYSRAVIHTAPLKLFYSWNYFLLSNCVSIHPVLS